MTKLKVEERLRMHIMTLCLASVAKQDGTIADAKASLINAVVSLTEEVSEDAFERGKEFGEGLVDHAPG